VRGGIARAVLACAHRGCALLAAVLIVSAFSSAAPAGEADVLACKVTCVPKPRGDDPAHRLCDFVVTVRHADEGWNHYANKWEVSSTSGEILATRILRHPHVDEQPFTRSLERVGISGSIGDVRVRAYDSLHAYGGAVVSVTLPVARSGERSKGQPETNPAPSPD